MVNHGILQAVGVCTHAPDVIHDEAGLGHMHPVVGAQITEGILVDAGVGAGGGIHGVEIIAWLPGGEESEVLQVRSRAWL